MFDKKIIIIGLVFIIMNAVTTHVQAGAKIHDSLSAKSFYVGEEFTYEILVSGAQKVEVDEPEESEDLRIQFVEKIKMDQATPPSIALRYRMMPTKPGIVYIPNFLLEADGKELMTVEDEEEGGTYINVAMPEAYPGLELQRELPTRDLYVGEPFRVDYQWKSPLSLSGYRAIQLYLPLFYDPQFKVRSIHHWIAGDDKAAIGLPVSNTRLIARYGNVEEAGKFYNRVSFSKIVIPSKPGEHVMPAASLLGSYVEPSENEKRARGWKTNYPSYFNNNFFEGIEDQKFKKYYVRSKQQTIHVLPLPDAGKPHDFSDQVGKRTISVTASPNVVAAGDPITLTIVMDGCEFPEVAVLPALNQQIAFTRQFAIPAKQSQGRIEGNKKTFIRTLRPLAQDVSAIPSVRLPYFDPKTQSYGVAESAPIPITVKAAETATAFDAQVSGSGPLRNHLEKNPEGIRANVTTLNLSASTFPNKLHWLLMVLIIPPLGFVVFYMATIQQRLMRRDPVRARANGAIKRFRKEIAHVSKAKAHLTSEQTLSQLDSVVRRYFADKLNLTQHAHTFEELKAILDHRVGELDLESLRTVYACCEDHSYRCHAKEPDILQLIHSAEQSILTIQRAIK
jgi:hypothetical protein